MPSSTAPPYAGSPARYRARRTDLLVFLHIFVVSQRQTFQRHHHAVNAPCTRPHLPRISSSASGFSSAASMMNRKSRGQKARQTRFAGVKENQIFSKTRQMHHAIAAADSSSSTWSRSETLSRRYGSLRQIPASLLIVHGRFHGRSRQRATA